MNEQTGLIADAAVTNGEVSQLEAERAAGRSGAHLFISAPPDSLLYSVYLQASAQRARPYRLVKAQTERWWFDFQRPVAEIFRAPIEDERSLRFHCHDDTRGWRSTLSFTLCP